MHCIRKVTDDITWVGADDRRLPMFEGVYSVPDGVSYNAYLLLDEKTVLFDTADKAVGRVFFENVAHVLAGRALDYIVVQHMEPDHSATLAELLSRYPGAQVLCSKKSVEMIGQFFGGELAARARSVAEGETLSSGRHEFVFLMAPMVHWPEVMVTYDKTAQILFSADAFGVFGALNGALFADEVDFACDYLPEARRYYANIIGKYGAQVQLLLGKLKDLPLKLICPLHGFVFRKGIAEYVEKYRRWSLYEPEEQGVVIAYASVYGNTENAAAILACKLRDMGAQTAMFDVSVTPASNIVAAAFRYSHLVFASTTYNAGVFITMDALLRDIAAHTLKNRTIAFLENGSWAPASGKLMREILASLPNTTFLDATVSIRSALRAEQEGELTALAEAICASLPCKRPAPKASVIEPAALFAISYGLFVLSTRAGEKDNGCIINTVTQVANAPQRISIAVSKANYTGELILQSGLFNISVLTEDAPFAIFTRFGFQSGRTADKFAGLNGLARDENGLYYLGEHTNALLSCRVLFAEDLGSHTLFIGELIGARKLSGAPSVTYDYYQKHIKQRPPAPEQKKKRGFVCTVCGYVYEGDTLPPDFICPVCKHGAEVFVPLA